MDVCKNCGGSGHNPSSQHLDCRECDAASERTLVEQYWGSLPATMEILDAIWAVYQFRRTPPVASRQQDLHDAIMRLPCDVPPLCGMGGVTPERAYREGHKDARHAAAELALAHAAHPAPAQQESEPKPKECSGDPACCPENEGYGCHCSSAPAPAALTDEVALREAIAEGLRGMYTCGRVWSAWSVGNMFEDDFAPAEETDECIDQVMDAIRPVLASAAPAEPPNDSSMPVDMSEAKRWIVQLRGRVDHLLGVINSAAPAEQARDAELKFLEHWLQFAASPLGMQCCGGPAVGAEYMGQTEMVCCGNGEPVMPELDEMLATMELRRKELVAAIASQQKGGGHA